MSVLRLVIGILFLLLLVIFTLSNTAPVRLGFWPTGVALEAPLSIAVLGAMAIAFVLGGLFVWLSELGQRRRARRAEHEARLLEEQVRELKARLPRVAVPPPG
jgi:uncharacterized integral membrane protein